ncbi:hypothetical protein MtrunA17_Chr3g0136461 [Medicago truncatula]|uniref:Uncharacterized protein n=1 Tax=Medicago truncatula TaxID=3880 RepID=A0A396J5J7_MEDTR|nr:hypothetical protein MtrunA17_Chr3g0136461 [Medicago truncatula]
MTWNGHLRFTASLSSQSSLSFPSKFHTLHITLLFHILCKLPIPSIDV